MISYGHVDEAGEYEFKVILGFEHGHNVLIVDVHVDCMNYRYRYTPDEAELMSSSDIEAQVRRIAKETELATDEHAIIVMTDTMQRQIQELLDGN